jgi:sugar fermentation stimulation protein A
MKWQRPLVKAQFEKRYKRFFADVILEKRTEVAHVANTGSLKSCLSAGVDCLVKHSDNPERKLRFSLEALKSPAGNWIGINTSVPGGLVKEAFEKKNFKHWNEFTAIESEVKLSAETRIDFVFGDGKIDRKNVLKSQGRLHFVEIKNVTLASGDYAVRKGRAHFPDSVTERGQKHLRELMALVKKGHTAEIFFCVQRTDCIVFSPADEIDPEYGKLLREAHKKGVRITAAIAHFDEQGAYLTGSTLPVVFED